MLTVGVSEAELNLSGLLDRVAQGEFVTITKQGQPVARLIPATPGNSADLKQVIEDLKEFRKGNRLNGLSIREMIEDGRK
jgi:prevent-host-death family protein